MTRSRFGEGVAVLGIDPGTSITGFGVVRIDRRRQAELVECGVIRTSSKAPLVARIREIHEAILELISEFEPATMSVEDVFQGKNVRSALTLGHAPWGHSPGGCSTGR